jgi:anti-sigma regulatory factor (Ser/Thr protein kinase)
MAMTAHRALLVTHPSQPAGARAAAREAAERLGFNENDTHRAGLVATELATNLVKHATHGGELLITAPSALPKSIELIAIDRGPGIRDMAQSMVDGHSTSGTLGTGLGAVKRLSDDFDAYSRPGQGTVIFVRVRSDRTAPPRRQLFDVGSVSVARPGEEVCGDACCVHQQTERAIAVMADGLGHGPLASEAAVAALGAMDPRRFSTTAVALGDMHAAIRHTRGAAAAVMEIVPGARVVRFTGVGNISASLCCDGHIRHAVSHNGTLGHEARLFREYAYPWTADSLVVMSSDGLRDQWSLSQYPGLQQRHPSTIAAVLYRDFSRQRDDVTVLVCREAACTSA